MTYGRYYIIVPWSARAAAFSSQIGKSDNARFTSLSVLLNMCGKKIQPVLQSTDLYTIYGV